MCLICTWSDLILAGDEHLRGRPGSLRALAGSLIGTGAPCIRVPGGEQVGWRQNNPAKHHLFQVLARGLNLCSCGLMFDWVVLPDHKVCGRCVTTRASDVGLFRFLCCVGRNGQHLKGLQQVLVLQHTTAGPAIHGEAAAAQRWSSAHGRSLALVI